MILMQLSKLLKKEIEFQMTKHLIKLQYFPEHQQQCIIFSEKPAF